MKPSAPSACANCANFAVSAVEGCDALNLNDFYPTVNTKVGPTLLCLSFPAAELACNAAHGE